MLLQVDKASVVGSSVSFCSPLLVQEVEGKKTLDQLHQDVNKVGDICRSLGVVILDQDQT